MQPREGVVERFGMTGRNRRLGHQIGGHVLRQETVAGRDRAAPIDTVRLVRQVNREAFGIFLSPDQRAFGAGDGDAEIIFVADANLRGADEGLAAVVQLAVNREVIIQLPAFDECFKLRAKVR